jgi:hypothetical protein
MEPERQEYKGHTIELRAPEGREEVRARGGREELRATEGEHREERFELLIDNQPVRYGQLPDGLYALEEYAFDWTDNLMDLARRFIDYRDRAEEIRREAESGEEN